MKSSMNKISFNYSKTIRFFNSSLASFYFLQWANRAPYLPVQTGGLLEIFWVWLFLLPVPLKLDLKTSCGSISTSAGTFLAMSVLIRFPSVYFDLGSIDSDCLLSLLSFKLTGLRCASSATSLAAVGLTAVGMLFVTGEGVSDLAGLFVWPFLLKKTQNVNRQINTQFS